MQNAAQYRQFAETLTIIAQDAQAPTRELILSAAKTWSALADEAEGASADAGNVINFRHAERRLRRL